MLTRRGHKGASESDGCVLYLDVSAGFMGLKIHRALYLRSVYLLKNVSVKIEIKKKMTYPKP